MKKYVFLFSTLMTAFCLMEWGTDRGIAAQTYTLTVTNGGSGHGTVTSSPAGINCGSDCTEVYNQDKKVTLKAKAASDSYFVGWSGDCSGKKNCSLLMNSDLSVAADFEMREPQISVFPDSLDFGMVEMGEKISETLKISNTGTGGLHVTISGFEGSDFSINGPSHITIKPQKSYKLKVTYKATNKEESSAAERTEEEVPTKTISAEPSSAGSKTISGTLKISSDDPKTPEDDIELTAVLIAPLVDALDILTEMAINAPDLGEYTTTESIEFRLCGSSTCQTTSTYLAKGTNDQGCSESGSGGLVYDYTYVNQNGHLNLNANVTGGKIDWIECCPGEDCSMGSGGPVGSIPSYQFSIPFKSGASQHIPLSYTSADITVSGDRWIKLIFAK